MSPEKPPSLASQLSQGSANIREIKPVSIPSTKQNYRKREPFSLL